MSEKAEPPDPLASARDEFISHWGAVGGAWGINRTMAQVHALLMTSERALTTDEVMADLKISRVWRMLFPLHQPSFCSSVKRNCDGQRSPRSL